jgi:hypothetical protein
VSLSDSVITAITRSNPFDATRHAIRARAYGLEATDDSIAKASRGAVNTKDHAKKMIYVIHVYHGADSARRDFDPAIRSHKTEPEKLAGHGSL